MTNLKQAARDAVEAGKLAVQWMNVMCPTWTDTVNGQRGQQWQETVRQSRQTIQSMESAIAALESALKEREPIIHEDELPEALPMSDELWAESYVDIVRVYPRQAVLEACYRHVCNQSELLKRIGSHAGDRPLPTTTLWMPLPPDPEQPSSR